MVWGRQRIAGRISVNVPISLAIQTLAKETNHEDLKDLKENFAGCMESKRFCLLCMGAALRAEGRPCRGGKSACPFEVFAVFVVPFFLAAPSRLATPAV
jgi:hypothetical protein